MLCNGTTEQIQYTGVFHMSRTLGTVARGVRTPIFREGDNVVEGVVSGVEAAHAGGMKAAAVGDAAAKGCGDTLLTRFSDLLDFVF